MAAPAWGHLWGNTSSLHAVRECVGKGNDRDAFKPPAPAASCPPITSPAPPRSPARHWPHCRQDCPALPNAWALPLQQQRLAATALGAGLQIEQERPGGGALQTGNANKAKGSVRQRRSELVQSANYNARLAVRASRSALGDSRQSHPCRHLGGDSPTPGPQVPSLRGRRVAPCWPPRHDSAGSA